jgi:hypothetical protein
MSSTTTVTAYQRALAAEPQLQPVVRLVDALCALVRPTDRCCAGCVWELTLKPLVTPLVGWGRGKMPEQAIDDPPGIRLLSLGELRAEEDARTIPAGTDTEAWLRTLEAYDAFTGELLCRLEAADPDNDHGIARGADS